MWMAVGRASGDSVQENRTKERMRSTRERGLGSL
jgi:hypothetical protein